MPSLAAQAQWRRRAAAWHCAVMSPKASKSRRPVHVACVAWEDVRVGLGCVFV